MEYETLIENVKEKYNHNDPGHDLAHIMRVKETCEAIGRMKAADLSVLIPAAILHDVVNVPKNSPDRLKASQLAAKEAVAILKEMDYPNEKVRKIANVIVEHSFSLGKKPTSLESAILQDADRLDAIGAIGIMRATSCGTQMGSSYYDVNDPFASNRNLDDKQFTLDHYYVKLFKLPELMNTAEGRDEAEKRVLFMREFLAQLGREISPPNLQ